MTSSRCLTSCFVLVFLAFSSSVSANTGEVTEGEKLFALQVKTLFAEKCFACHADESDGNGGGFDMRTRAAMLVGGDEFGEAVLVPGNAHVSHLYLVTTHAEPGFEMPPKESERLTEEQTRWIRDWINQGAPWPSDQRIAEIQASYAEGMVVETSGGLSGDWNQRRYQPELIWAYRPLSVEPVPVNEHPIDWFVNAKLREIDLAPAPTAGPGELARRLSFNLTGLPPEPERVEHFTNRYHQDMHEAIRDYANELMATPHYGEHFGRHWLDVTRYADSAGFANDYTRPNAWRYRDYVVRAFNEDKPYSDFVREQIAGDEILQQRGQPAAVTRDQASDPAPAALRDSELLIATGFLRMGPWEQTGMSVFRITRQQWLDDVTDGVGQAFLAHPLQCAKCHDHKFDPIPTRDYYRLMAVFSTTQFADREAPFLECENLTGFDEANHWVEAKVAAYQDQHQTLSKQVNRNQKAETSNAKVGDNSLDPGDEASLARMRKNISRHSWELQKTEPVAFSVHTGKTIERANVSGPIALPQNPWGKGALEEDSILVGGDAFRRGDPVTPGPLSAAQTLGEMREFSFSDGQGARRLALANWIVDETNPLTARVIVNRVWGWHFGKGIAGNPNNFGGTGRLPTHPALLDYLAQWFMDHGWSIKKLNHLILSSETYRRSTRHPDQEALAEKDPQHDSYAAMLPRRLSAEELRDAMLAISGELNRQVGGVPCRPDINLEVAMQPRQIMGGAASVYEPDPLPGQRNRRTLYAERIRGLRDPFLETFNQPGPDLSCELRETSTIAPQALTMLNAAGVQDRALAMAARLIREGGSEEEIIARAFDLALARAVTETEQQACLGHWAAATQAEEEKTYEFPEYPTEITRTVMAEKTGEPYAFIEIMPAYENYVPNLQPVQTDAQTRGLAQVCLVILNLNEFAYLD